MIYRVIFLAFVFWPAIVSAMWYIVVHTRRRRHLNKTRRYYQAKMVEDPAVEWAAIGYVEVKPGQWMPGRDRAYQTHTYYEQEEER